jgi:hypothetical protein
MNEADLDRAYTALCQALGDVGPQRSELLLAMVSLALLARMPEAGEAIAIVARSRERCLRDGALPHDLDQARLGSPS